LYEVGEKSESFSRESEQDRSPFLTVREHEYLGNVPVERFRRDKTKQKKPPFSSNKKESNFTINFTFGFSATVP
jgi:hypothetical protein